MRTRASVFSEIQAACNLVLARTLPSTVEEWEAVRSALVRAASQARRERDTPSPEALSENEKVVLRHFARDTDVAVLSDGDILAVDCDDMPPDMTRGDFESCVNDLSERGYVARFEQNEHAHYAAVLLAPARDFLTDDATDDENEHDDPNACLPTPRDPSVPPPPK